ncbi:MAG: PGPGW domain-containing protein, partial [Planctomycetales bacterium]
METKPNPQDHDGFHRFIERFAFWKRLPQPFRMMAAVIIGCALILAGIIMLFTPGQGLLTILAGLAVIGTEFHWARRSVQFCVRQFMSARDYVL